jgi:hypothetical protein
MGSGIPSNVVFDSEPHPANAPPNVKFDDSPGDPGVPNMPSEVAGKAAGAASGVVKTIGKMLPRIGTQVGGAEVGGALGSALGPVGTVAGAAIGGGIGNVVGSRLPPAIGGDPSESTLHAFGWGAIPEAIGRGVAGFIEKKAATKGAEAAHDAVVNALDKGANPMPAEEAADTAEALGRASMAAPKPLTGEALSDATSSLREDIQGPITDMRVKLGQPIGNAYEALKGKPPISEKDAADIAEAAQGVKDEMISPSPKASVIFAKIKNFVPQAAEETPKNVLLEQPGGEVIQRPAQLPDPNVEKDFFRKLTPDQVPLLMKAEEAKGSKLTFPEMQQAIAGGEKVTPPTPDELREIRQVIGSRLATAKGGDRHALAGLQQAIDEKLMPMLPEGISRDRDLYHEFMNRFPWRDVNKVNQLGTPRELGNYVFGGTPERTAEIIESSSPEGKVALREALTDHALNAVNPDAPLADQVKSIRKVLTPYIKNGSAASLYGAKNADQLREVFYTPEHLAQMKQIVAQPEFHDATVNEVTALMRSGNRTKIDAVEAGWQKVIQSLPKATREALLNPTVPGAEMPALPTAQQAIQTGLTPSGSGIASRIARRAEFTAPMAAGRAMTGSVMYGAGQLVGMAGIAGTSAGYRAIMENGGAGALSHLYASPTHRMIARNLIETLAAIGTQTERVATQPKQAPTP